MRVLENERVTAPAVLGGDGIMVRGDDGETVVRRCVVEFSGVPLEDMDEAASFVQGANARVVQCRFTGAGKLVLCGSGDTPELDAGAHVTFEECIFSGFGRRAPEAQDGVRITLHRCFIKDWGTPERFTVRSFGAWAHHGAMITASQCVFWQSRAWPGLRQALTDLGNWIGWSFNQRSLRPLDYLLPGQFRALTASQGGRVLATYCYKNRWWLRVAGHVGPRMRKKDALDLVTYLESVCPQA